MCHAPDEALVSTAQTQAEQALRHLLLPFVEFLSHNSFTKMCCYSSEDAARKLSPVESPTCTVHTGRRSQSRSWQPLPMPTLTKGLAERTTTALCWQVS